MGGAGGGGGGGGGCGVVRDEESVVFHPFSFPHLKRTRHFVFLLSFFALFLNIGEAIFEGRFA